MHVRRKSSRTDRALDQAKDLGATAQAKAVEAAAGLSERAQTTLVPAAEEAARKAQEKFRTDVKPALQSAAATATAAAAAAAEAAREEAARRGEDAGKRTRKARKDLAKSTKKARKRARKRGAADRARAAVGRDKPKRNWLRTIAIGLGLAGVAAFVAKRLRGDDEVEIISTTPTAPPPAPIVDDPVAIDDLDVDDLAGDLAADEGTAETPPAPGGPRV
ncbi:MAG: hypothetical protein H0U77_08220 [Nocardioidaceae bacterium]|nr:hypothetical protein [Nocardioidaceae bacterium]